MFPVVILAAGRGTRLGRIGERFRKVLLPIGDGSLLKRHLHAFSAIGSRRFVLVVDPCAAAVEEEARKVLETLGGRLELVVQDQPRGIGHAALLAADAVAGEPFIVVLGDTYCVPCDLTGAVRRLVDEDLDAVLSVRPVEDAATICKECTIELNEQGYVHRIVEKPQVPLSWLKPCGVYFFGPAMLNALNNTPCSKLRGEIELTDAIQTLIDRGGRVGVHHTLTFDVNISRPQDVLEANLEWLTHRTGGCFVHPDALVGEDARLETCVVSGPARIGARACLTRCVVFPRAEVAAGERFVDALILPSLGVINDFPTVLSAEGPSV